jgi:hypothetical protein
LNETGLIFFYRDDRHGPPAKKSKDEEEEEDLNDANYDEVIHSKKKFLR